MAEKPYRRALCWVRRDLRTFDHAALAEATARAEGVAVVFVFDRHILDPLPDRDDRRLTFIHRALEEMDARLRERGSLLLVRVGKPEEEIPRLAKDLDAEAVFAGRDYDPYATGRDAAIAKAVTLELSKDVVIFEAGEVLTQDGKPFRAYAPYRNAWMRRFDAKRDAAERKPDLAALLPAKDLRAHERPWDYPDIGFERTELWLEAGEKAGRERMRAFAKTLPDYGENRNEPAKRGTSELSVHFRFGTVSVREAARLAVANDGEKWLSEMVWRDFFQDVLAHFPEVVHEAYKPMFRNVRYPGKPEHLEAWQAGRTGFPIVDAAMRAFNATGFMHNRLRLIVSSFLCKDLLLDYREGEAYFARFLLDFELANNNGNWQWSASTGTDAQPYFRIFNPTTQGERYDPTGAFVREWLPELARLPDRWIHEPAEAPGAALEKAGIVLDETYPRPIVDHAVQRAAAKALLRDAAAAANGD